MHQRKSVLATRRPASESQTFVESIYQQVESLNALPDVLATAAETSRIAQVPRLSLEHRLSATTHSPHLDQGFRTQVTSLHMDCHGLDGILYSEGQAAALQAGDRLMCSVDLLNNGGLQVRARIVEIAEHTESSLAPELQEGCPSLAHRVVLRFEFLAEADRQRLNRFLMQPTAEAYSKTQSEPTEAQRIEKRRYRRFVRSLPVEFQILGATVTSDEVRAEMITLDLSTGGLKIRTSEGLQVNDRLYVRLELDGQAFFSLAEVVWTESSRLDGCLLAGLSFVDLPDGEQTRLASLLDR